MLITISWTAWSGKWTVSKILAQKLWYQYISIWDLKRKLAEEMWLNIIEFNKLWTQEGKEKEFDLKYEEYQKNFDINDNIILESRLWFFCQPWSFKIFLKVDDKIAAQRIMWDHRSTDKFNNIDEAIQITKNRNQEDIDRFKKLYNIDFHDPSNFDLVIDTSDLDPDQTIQKIINNLPSDSD